MPDGDRRIVVEIFSHEAEQRLRNEMQQIEEQHRAEIDRLEKRFQALNRTLYECIEVIGTLRNKR